MTITFTKDKDTKNTVRFAEVVEGDAKPVVGAIYLQKEKAQDYGDSIQVEISAA